MTPRTPAASADPPAESGAAGVPRLLDFTQRQIEQALRERVRYRYVQPRVWKQNGSYRVESPCCSSNVDPAGGPIDIARLQRRPSGVWRLYSRDHTAGRWQLREESPHLRELLDALCIDAHRVFWP